jgi:glutathionyl-hydroquinone reductase
MYCKQCGHRSDEKTENCQKCGAKLTSEAEYTTEAPRKVRLRTFLLAAGIGAVVFIVAPRFFLRSELETIGPTDKLRFLRAVKDSQYRRAGQQNIRIEDQTLVVVWDLRWNSLPENKQREIVRIVGHAWNVVGGKETNFRIEGQEETVASFTDNEVRLQ